MAIKCNCPENEIAKVLCDTRPFNLLSEIEFEKLLSESETTTYTKGSYIYRRGEKSKRILYVVIQGQAMAINNIGKEDFVTAIHSRGEFFGITVLITNEPYPVSVVASQDLTCLMIKQKVFEKVLSSNQQFSDFFIRYLAKRLKELYKSFSNGYEEVDVKVDHPLRRRVGEVSIKNVITSFADENIQTVANKMKNANVSSVVIVDSVEKPQGIITHKDLVDKVMASGNFQGDLKAVDIMSSPLLTTKPDDFIYNALLLMQSKSVKHIVVVDENERLNSIIGIKDIIKSSASGNLAIVNSIEEQKDYEGLSLVIEDIDQVQQALIIERAHASEICYLITELYDRVTRKVIEIAENLMVAEGWGTPPVKYCYINMGSAGRKEQYARTDQDNGIIYDGVPGNDEEVVQNYFLKLGTKIVRGLEICGFERCDGNVMAENPAWCMSLPKWKETINNWVKNLDPMDIRNITIFLDFRYLACESKLGEDLKHFVVEIFRNSNRVLHFLANDDLQHRVPLSIFRRFITEKKGEHRGKVNLKTGATVHFVDCTRVFALREGIHETNTFERIKRLREKSVFNRDDAELIETAYETLMMCRIKDALNKKKKGQKHDNYIDVRSLSKKEKDQLKESFVMITQLQSMLANSFQVRL